MGILKSADARRPSRPRIGHLLPLSLRRHLAVEHRRQLAAWPDPDLPLLVLDAPPADVEVSFQAVVEPRDRATLSQRVTTYTTAELATKLVITVLRVADGNHESIIDSRAAKHTETARRGADGAERGLFTDRTPRLPPAPQPWAPISIVIEGAKHEGRQQSLSSAEQLAYTNYDGALIELHAHAIDLANTRLRREPPAAHRLGG